MSQPAYQEIKNYSLSDLKDTLKFYKDTVDKTVKTSKYKSKMDIYNFLKSQNYEVGTIDKKVAKAPKAPPKARETKAPKVAKAPKAPKAPTKATKTYDIDNLKMVGENEEEFQILDLEKAYKIVDKYLTKNDSEYGKLRKELNAMIKKSNKYEEQIKADKNNEDLKIENRKLGLLIGQQHTKLRNIMGKDFGVFSNYLYYKPNFQDYN